MSPDSPIFSPDFQHLYCDRALFERLSTLHPVSFTRVLPFQHQDPVVDSTHLLTAESAHLANPSDATRLAVVEALGDCGLLPGSDVTNLKPMIDFFNADFFELMGEVYANAGMFICALRWHREFIIELETRRPNTITDTESVYASVGYCLYSLGLYPEAITWSKSCIGPRQTVDTVSCALIDYEAKAQGGTIQAIDRASNRTRYIVSTSDPQQATQITPRLKQAVSVFAPLQETYIDWIRSNYERSPYDQRLSAFDQQFLEPLTRHRMNLIFSLCAYADEMATRGYVAEAKRLLFEANLLESKAEFVREKLNALSR
jgi:hypothetical protein